MKPTLGSTLTSAVDALQVELGENLLSCCVYGSVVRGNAVEGVSDLNLLIILRETTSRAEQAIARALEPYPLADPFVLPHRGFERSVRAFATKFASIRRNYRVVYGADFLVDLKIDAQLERFLCEQAIRNARLRLGYSYITRKQHKGTTNSCCAT